MLYTRGRAGALQLSIIALRIMEVSDGSFVWLGIYKGCARLRLSTPPFLLSVCLMTRSVILSLSNIICRLPSFYTKALPSIEIRTFATMHKSPAAKLQQPIAAETSIHQPRDPNTLSNYNSWRCQHVTANLDIDFKGQRMHGSVLLQLKRQHAEEHKVLLDTRCVMPHISRILDLDMPLLQRSL